MDKKKDKIEVGVVDETNLPEMLDGKHRVIPIITGDDDTVEETTYPR